MRGVHFDEVGSVSLRELPDPEIVAPTDVLVRVQASSICGSDLHIVAGHLTPETGFPLGHEYVGEIVDVGAAVTRFAIGDRIAGPAAPWCGSCRTCRRGQRQRCARGGILGSGEAMGGLGGAQSTLLRVPWADQDLVPVPTEVSDAAAVSIGDILSTGWSGVRKADPQAGETVVVIGCGPVGLSAVHTAQHLTGAAQVVAVDPVESRRELAQELGADAAFAPGADTAEAIRELTEGIGASAIVDAAGVQATIDLACDLVSVGGRIAELGIAAKPFQIDFGALLMKNATIWTGLGDLSRMQELVDLLARGALDPTPIFNRTCRLDEVPEMYAHLAEGDPAVVKVLVTFEGGGE